jgi:hypothetical protein
MVKPKTIVIFDRDFADPEHYLTYEECGLVNIIPWELKAIEPKANTAEEKQAEEAYAKLEAPQ